MTWDAKWLQNLAYLTQIVEDDLVTIINNIFNINPDSTLHSKVCLLQPILLDLS